MSNGTAVPPNADVPLAVIVSKRPSASVSVSVASRGERLGDWLRQVKPEDLVNLALSNLSLSHNDVLREDSHQPMDMARIARLASQLTGSKHE
jgi:hypothetical protein